jgi:hypothetical protein
VFGYQLETEYTEEELKQMEEAASAQRREIVVFSVISLIVKFPVHTFTQEYHRIPKNTPIIPKITLRGPVNIPERPRNR